MLSIRISIPQPILALGSIANLAFLQSHQDSKVADYNYSLFRLVFERAIIQRLLIYHSVDSNLIAQLLIALGSIGNFACKQSHQDYKVTDYNSFAFQLVFKWASIHRSLITHAVDSNFDCQPDFSSR